MATMTAIKRQCISGEQPPHDSGNGNLAGVNWQGQMIGEKGPRKTTRRALRRGRFQPRNKITTIFIIIKDPLALNAADDNLLQRSWCIYSRFAWHMESLLQ
jgi:hypothetical protein